MVLALPVFHPGSGDRVLLKPSYRLDDSIIGRLQKMKIDQVWIRYPRLDAVSKYINADLVGQKAQMAAKLRQTFEGLQAEANAAVPVGMYISSLGAVINELLENPAAVIFIDEAGEAYPDTINHCLRVAYLSVLIGMKLDAYLVRERWRLNPKRAKQVGNLGLGAALHDVGLLRLPKQVAEKHADPDDLDDPQWQKHAQLGYEMLGRRVDPSARAIVLHHHQHFDGSGFPPAPAEIQAGQDSEGEGAGRTGQRGHRIHVYARIVCVANVYDRLRTAGGADRLPAVEAIRRMLEPPYVHWFDPVVLDAFLKVTPPYPPGLIVKLNDGREVVAIEHHPDDPCRPTVQVLDPSVMASPNAEAGGEGELELIDLRETPHLHVAEAEGRDVAEMNFHPTLAPQLT